MIVVKLTGGLGNQLFQYAFGKYLSLKNKTSLGVNYGSLEGNKDDQNHRRRVMHLEDFGVSFSRVSNKDLRKYLFITGNKIIDDYLLLRIKKFHKKAFFEGSKPVNQINEKDICTIGYFTQGNSDWLKSIYPILKREFRLRKKENIKEILKKINKSNSVSMHIRRGDLSTLKNAFVLPTKYYQQAVNEIQQVVNKPQYFIFSDDIAWCKNNFDWLENKHFVENTSVSEDLELMKSCKHNIIANSTLSWWAGYLNANPKKIVVQPNHMGSFKNSKEKQLILLKSKVINVEDENN